MFNSNAIVVGVADVGVSADPHAALVTYGLGSCIAVLLHDRARLAAGCLHFMLPDSQVNPARARACPATFADTGVDLLMRQMHEIGSQPRDLVCKIVGGASLRGGQGIFGIGRRNIEVATTLLQRRGIRIVAAQVGGTVSRTPQIAVGTGRVTVRVGQRLVEL